MSKIRTKKPTERTRRLYVFDTNVLMHDPSSLLRFQEHDIYIPQVVLEELDNHKKGVTEIARNSRETSRFIEGLFQAMEQKGAGNYNIGNGLPLSCASGGQKGMGRLFIQTDTDSVLAKTALNALSYEDKPDNHIIFTARSLRESRKEYERVVVVSKDINVRIKARTLGIPAEDYESDRIETGSDKAFYSGMLTLPENAFDDFAVVTPPSGEADSGLYRMPIPRLGTARATLYPNQLVQGGAVPCAIVQEIVGDAFTFRHCINYERRAVSGIFARNTEQNFLLNLLLNPGIDLVSILGSAGTGKTLLTLAAGLALKRSGVISGITVTRALVPVGEDIGFLPGTEEEKVGPWMGAIDDNIEVIEEALASQKVDEAPVVKLQKKLGTQRDSTSTEADGKHSQQSIRREFQTKSISFMRGRTFFHRLVIIDEAQNLTPKQMETLITRAGPQTKIVCLGNFEQIDTPYLTEGSSGLAYLIDRFKGWEHYGHVTLSRVERSRLAEYAVKVM